MNNKVSSSGASYILNLIVVGVVLLFILWLVTRLIVDGLYPLASILAAIAVLLGMIYLRPRFTPFRWMGVGIALAMLFTLYPIFYTFYLSFTNMGSGHLMSKQQAIDRLEKMQYLPEEGETYKWTAYRTPQDDYALWLIPAAGPGLLAKPGEPIAAVNPGEAGVGQLDADSIPTQLAGYERMPLKSTVAIIDTLGAIEFGEPPNTVRIRSLKEAAASKPLYKYDAGQDVIVNEQTGEVYTPIEGTFTSASGEELTPGYIVSIGWRQFALFLGNEGFRQPLTRVLIWNIAFAFLSVSISFVVGLVVTLMFDDLPGRQTIRALLIIPWPIPVLISVLIWRSMLNPDLGFVAPILEAIFGSSPSWFQNPFWTRFALVMVNVWLSYPYFYVITAGALRSISEEIYGAAIVDGAGPWKKLYYITLPLILRILTPLLIASFTFNFNNFNVIYIFNYGNPPMPNTIVPMGHTDILISFVYRLAFITSNVTNYGLAAAITIMLFLFVSMMVLIQVRFTNIFKETDL